MLNEIITIYAITDDLLKALGHDEDCRREVSDAEIITTAIIAAIFFYGNHSKACSYMKDHNLIPDMLEKSRFNRRGHNVSMLINDGFHQLGMIIKETSDCTEYLLAGTGNTDPSKIRFCLEMGHTRYSRDIDKLLRI